ncbi:MAG TPA: RDD family protein [Patescibacteria group bacterium]|nr:RDD family protein [Patescibacteria group bacterium]
MTTPQPTWQTPPESAGPAPGIQFAGHGARLGAFILDAILVSVFVTAFALVLTLVLFGSLEWSVDASGDVVFGDTAAAAGSILLAVAGFTLISILALLYFPLSWARGGQTPGMRVTGIRVVSDRDGSRIGWGAAILRLIGWWISAAAFYFGFAWILIDSRRRGWHDLIAGTCVISTR